MIDNLVIIILLQMQTVVNGHRYHIDALLQLSDIMHLGEDLQVASELVGKAI